MKIYILLACAFLFASCDKEIFEAKAQEIAFRIPSGKHLEIINNQLHLDGERFRIVEANSPESRLRECSFAELDQLNACGINTIYATLYGGDVTSIHPFIDRNNPGRGFNDEVVNNWLAYLEHWVFGYTEKHIVHLLLSEKENHFTLSETNHKNMITYLTTKFKSIEGYVIYNREELPTGQTEYINNYYRHLKQQAPYSIRGIHNNTGQNPWNGFQTSSDTLIQFLGFQEWGGNFDRRIRSQVPAGKWAGYASEVTGGFQTYPNCVNLTNTLFNAGGQYSSGMGFFISSKDQSAPTFHGSYCGCYQHAANLAGDTENDTVVVPPTGNIVIEYSAHYSLSPSTILNNGATLQQLTGGYWFLVKTGTGTFTFSIKKGTSNPVTYSDSSPIYSFKIWLQRGYVYTLTVTNGGNVKTIFFSVN